MSRASRSVPGKVFPLSYAKTLRNKKREAKQNMVTLTNGELYNLKEYLQELAQIDVPAKVGIHLARLVRRVAAVIQEIEAARTKLITKYGETVDGQLIITADSPRRPDFNKEYQELMAEKTDIEGNKVFLPGDTKIAIRTLLAFESFIEVQE